MLYTFHFGTDNSRIKASCLASSPQEAVTAWPGAEFVELKGFPPPFSTDPDDLNIVGLCRFEPEMFREMDETDRALAGVLSGDIVYTENGMALLSHRGVGVDLVMRQHHISTKPTPLTRLGLDPEMSDDKIRALPFYDQFKLSPIGQELSQLKIKSIVYRQNDIGDLWAVHVIRQAMRWLQNPDAQLDLED